MSYTIEFQGLTELIDQMKAAPLVMDRAIKSAVKSALYHVRKKLLDAMATNEFNWPELKPFPTNRQIRGLSYGKNDRKNWENPKYQKPRNWFGPLGKLMFYEYNPDKFSGEVGAVDAAGQNPIPEKFKQLWRKLQSGFTKPVDESSRGMFGAIGFPIQKTTTVFTIPPRPLFGPVADKRAQEVNSLLQLVIADKIANGFEHTDMLDALVGK